MNSLGSRASEKKMENSEVSYRTSSGKVISNKEITQKLMKEDLKVLLIDDDPVANFINKAVIKEYVSKDVEIAINGMQAIRILEDLVKQNNCPEFILLDMNMPVMNGMEFLEAFQKLGPHPRIKIVILTSFIGKLDTFKIMQCQNIKGWLKKPLTKRSVDLLNIII